MDSIAFPFPIEDMTLSPEYGLYLPGNEDEVERDFQYMQFLYPKEVQILLGLVEEEADKLEYEGSIMFDTHPDKIYLLALVNKIVKIAITQPEVKSLNENMSYLRPIY